MSTKSSCGVCFVQFARRKSFDRTNRGWITTAIHLLNSTWAFQFLAENNIVVYWNSLLFMGSCSVWHFPFHQSHEGHQGNAFWMCGGHQSEESSQQYIEVWQTMIKKYIRFEGCYFEAETMFDIRSLTFQTDLVFWRQLRRFVLLFFISYGLSVSFFDLIQSLLSNCIMKVTLKSHVPRSFYLNAGFYLPQVCFLDTFCSLSSLTTCRMASVHEIVALSMTQLFIYRFGKVKLAAAVEN